MKFWDDFRRTGLIMLDGAMGTELEYRGAPVARKGWAVSALADQPALVRSVHEDYVEAGASIHTTQTFSAARHVLDSAGLGERYDQLNRAAVRLCRDAIAKSSSGRPQWIAGSISTYSEGSDRANLPPHDRLATDFADQASLLAACGVDLIALEMLYDVAVSQLAIAGALATGLPVMLGFTCMHGAEGSVVETHSAVIAPDRQRLSLEAVLKALLSGLPAEAPVILAIMHSSFDATDAALEVIERLWTGPVAVYPNSGDYLAPHWQFDTVCTPEEFAEAAARWAVHGVDIIGGCCGVGPDHIRAAGARLSLH